MPTKTARKGARKDKRSGKSASTQAGNYVKQEMDRLKHGGSKKPTVESHKQVEIRATVCPVPYVAAVRTEYKEGGWRATGKL